MKQEEIGEFVGKQGLLAKWKERTPPQGVTTCMEAARSGTVRWKRSAPPEWHLDCDSGDPETGSSPDLSRWSNGGLGTSPGTGAGTGGG